MSRMACSTPTEVPPSPSTDFGCTSPPGWMVDAERDFNEIPALAHGTPGQCARSGAPGASSPVFTLDEEGSLDWTCLPVLDRPTIVSLLQTEHLEQYTGVIREAGYLFIEDVLGASEEEMGELLVVAGLRRPEARRFRAAVERMRTG